MAWQKGPLPPNTWGWGGVVPMGGPKFGFYFADFCGSHVKLISGNPPWKELSANEVAWYDNSLTVPQEGFNQDDSQDFQTARIGPIG